MKLQVLVAAMRQADHALLKRMNIRTDAIIGNQCDRNEVEVMEYEGHRVMYLSFRERGVGLNRNNALMRADADICILSDTDIVYEDNYEEIILGAFQKHPEADVIVFNIRDYIEYQIPSFKRLHIWNMMRYGSPQIAFRLKRVKEHAIYFNECFGGGTEHQHGEDSLFLKECLDKGLKLYASPEYIAKVVAAEPSTWFHGYTDRYFVDTGALYHAISERWWKPLCLRDAVKRRREYGVPPLEAYRKMVSYRADKN